MEPIRLTLVGPGAPILTEVENALRIVPGVISVRMAPTGHDVLVEAAGNLDPSQLVEALQKAGHIATVSG